MYKMGDKTELPSDSEERARFCLYAIQQDLIEKHDWDHLLTSFFKVLSFNRIPHSPAPGEGIDIAKPIAILIISCSALS